MSVLSPGKIGINFGYTYGFVYGGGSGAYSGVGDWLFARGASPTYPLSSAVGSAADALVYTDTDHASFTDAPIWFYLPLLKGGYLKSVFIIQNVTGVNCAVTGFLIAENTNILSVGPISAAAYATIGGFGYATTLSYVGSGVSFSKMEIGVGMGGDNSDDSRVTTDWISGGLLVRITPASDPPGGGHLNIHAWRSR